MYVSVNLRALPPGFYLISLGAIQQFQSGYRLFQEGKLTEALDKFEKAAILGSPWANYYVAICLLEDPHFNTERVHKHLLAACNTGVGEAMMTLARYYEIGTFSEQESPSWKTAYTWYNKAANLNMSGAMEKLYELGSRHPEVVPPLEKTLSQCAELSP